MALYIGLTLTSHRAESEVYTNIGYIHALAEIF